MTRCIITANNDDLNGQILSFIESKQQNNEPFLSDDKELDNLVSISSDDSLLFERDCKLQKLEASEKFESFKKNDVRPTFDYKNFDSKWEAQEMLKNSKHNISF